MRFGYLLVFMALFVFCGTPTPADAPPATTAETPPPTAQDVLDNTFRQMYAQARREIKEKTSPVIISMLGNLILVRNGQSEQHSVLSPEWQTLKTVDHIPLAIFVALQARTDAPIDDATRASLINFREKIVAAGTEIAAMPFTPETAARQKQIQDESVAFVQQVLNAGSVTRAELDAYAGRMGKLALLNADDAEVLEMGTVDKLVREWKSQMSPEEWRNLRVIVSDAHMPREQEREMLYFEALLGENREGHRIVFAENGEDEQKVLDLLATHRLDEQVAISFFHDPWRMHRDLLSDGAKHWIAKHQLPR
jgi:hypothetical protein